MKLKEHRPIVTSRSPHLFLCHSSKDKKFVRRLARDLISLSASVWFDEWQLEIGDSLHGCIGSALEESAFVGVVLSPDSVQSRWCRSELDQALTREKRTGNKVVLPLLYRRVNLPPFLEGRLYLNFSKSYFQALAELAGLLYQLNKMVLTQALQEIKPKNVEEVKIVLSRDSHSPFRTAIIPADTYKQIRELLLVNDVEIGNDMFQINSEPLFDVRLPPDVIFPSDLERHISYLCVDQVLDTNSRLKFFPKLLSELVSKRENEELYYVRLDQSNDLDASPPTQQKKERNVGTKTSSKTTKKKR